MSIATNCTEAHPRMPVLETADAWRRLPRCSDYAQPLPTWARQLADPIPITTARMLELDAMHRSGHWIDDRLRCIARWSAADANRCEYSRRVAASDLERTGSVNIQIGELLEKTESLRPVERATAAFARTLMQEAHAVTDLQVSELIAMLGEERMMALVALLAHASFQDRVVLALQSPLEPAAGTEPFVGQFHADSARHAHVGPMTMPAMAYRSGERPPNWRLLRTELAKQQQQPGRIRVPTPAEVLRRIGPEHPTAWQIDILWSRVAYGYQPELTDAWFRVVNAFRQESNLGPVFSNSIFWVVTQALNCFY